MNSGKSPIKSKKALDTYFLDNRARLLDIASFLDRIDRYEYSEEAKSDFRYQSFIKALHCLLESEKNRTKSIQMIFSDLSIAPIESVIDPKAYGACEKAVHEDN